MVTVNQCAKCWNAIIKEEDRLVGMIKTTEIRRLPPVLSALRTANRGGSLTDDQLTANDLRELFPSSAADFADVCAEPTLERTEDVVECADEMPLLSDEQMNDVCQAHAEIVRVAVRANWIEPAKAVNKPDFVTPLMER